MDWTLLGLTFGAAVFLALGFFVAATGDYAASRGDGSRSEDYE